jgi:hypothetical protein
MLAYVYTAVIVSICIYRSYCTSLGFPRVYYVFTIPYTRLGLYIFFYLYMIIQNTQYTYYSLWFSVLLSLKLTMSLLSFILLVNAKLHDAVVREF